ncbi:MAG TPA: PspC domain-containing protein [Candidatus Limnocylindria bacterium]|nr:PspC domain-containing protein [Candidatus Limnocylindria bacterium]
MSRRLERSRANRVIAGVCGGLGEYLDIDATFVRVAMVALAFVGGIGILVYIVLLVLMPLPGESPLIGPASTVATSVPPVPADPAAIERRRNMAGLFLVALGVVFLLGNLGLFRGLDWKYIWPLVVIALGVLLLAQRTRR